MNEIQIYSAAIRTFGEQKQEDVAIEECAELIQAISHKHRGRENNIAEEIADVEIMLEQQQWYVYTFSDLTMIAIQCKMSKQRQKQEETQHGKIVKVEQIKDLR